jgi:hypothetical protein
VASPESGDNQKAFKIPEEYALGRGGSSARELDVLGHLRLPVFIVILEDRHRSGGGSNRVLGHAGIRETGLPSKGRARRELFG